MLYACPMTLRPAISRDLRNFWSILDPVSSWGQEMLVWLPSSYSVAVSAVFTVHCLLSKTHGSELTALITKLTRNGLPLENRWFLKWPKPKWGLSCGESLTTAMHGYAMPKKSSSSPQGWWIESPANPHDDMTSFHQNRGAPWSLTLDFPGTQTSASNFGGVKKNHPCSTTQRGGQTKAEDQPQWLTKDEAPTIPNSVLS